MSTSWRVPNHMQNEPGNNFSAGMGFRLGEFHQEGKKQFLNETLGAPKPIMCLTKTLWPKQLDLVVSPQLGSMGRGPKSRHLNASNESSSLGNPSCFAQRRQQIGDFLSGRVPIQASRFLSKCNTLYSGPPASRRRSTTSHGLRTWIVSGGMY